MSNEIIIKVSAKYDNYELKLLGEDLLAIGCGKRKDDMEKEIKKEKLIKDTLELGKKLYNIYRDYIKKTSINDSKGIKQKEFENFIQQNEPIKALNCFCELKEKNWIDYKIMQNFYSKAYFLLQRNKQKYELNGLNVDLIYPKLLNNLITKNYAEKDTSINNILTLKDAETTYNNLLKIFINHPQIDTSVLTSYLKNIPFKIDDIDKIIDIYLSNKNSLEYKLVQEVITIIKNYLKKYGMPFWTNEKDIGKIINQGIDKYCLNYQDFMDYSKKIRNENNEQEIFKNIIPIHNLLYISIIIYLYTDLLNEFAQNDKDDFILNAPKYKEKFDRLNLISNFDGDYDYALDILGEYLEEFDEYIKYYCNRIYRYPLKEYRKKIHKGKNNYKTLNIYESIAFASWDVFVTDFFEIIDKPTCDICKKEASKMHTLRKGETKHLCDECYKKHKNKLGAYRVKKYRKKANQNG